MSTSVYKRHWSFVVTDPVYIYSMALALLVAGFVIAYVRKDASYATRMGNFIIGAGVWMSMRYTLREGIRPGKSRPPKPPANQIDVYPINQAVFATGDARLQVHGFILVLLGSAVGSFGDLLFRAACSWLSM